MIQLVFVTNNQGLILGIDLVAMNVNDVLVQGAEPLFFLDYYACGKLNVDDAAAFVKGVADGCLQSGCALLGGETAEMPSLYVGSDFDGAGAAIGAVERGKTLPRKDLQQGDILLGLASSGCHSNGFSLIRKVLERAGVSYDDGAPWDQDMTVGASLLIPTKIYCKSFLAAHRGGFVKAASHITGGGFVENIPRMLPFTLSAVVDGSAWPVPELFKWLAKTGSITATELARTFNMGIGMVLVISAEDKEKVALLLQNLGEEVYEIGRLIPRDEGIPGCVVDRMDQWTQ
jgi:phosphoribosylaminoimidazole synthetase